MVNPYRFYTYAYLRVDRTPYYIGKGRGNRAYYKYKGTKPPKDKSRIILLKQNLTEEESFKHEKYMIAVFGRKDLGTGILHNRTDGGDGSSGLIRTEEHKSKIRKSLLGRPRSQETKEKLRKANLGKIRNPCSQETKDKIGAANRGKKHSKESKEKIGAIWSNWWRITFDDNSEIVIFGLSSWCKKNSTYKKSCLLCVSSGKQKKHKDIVSVEKLAHYTPIRPS